MDSVIGALRVVLGLDTAAFEKGLGLADRQLNKMAKSFDRIGKQMRNVGTTLSVAVTAPIVGFGALTLKAAGDFEAGMNRVQAATGSTNAQFEAMRELAKKLGVDTQYSAAEAADAMETLAKNGIKTEDILGGATDAALKLAAASGTDMAGAADVATDVMQNFNKRASDLPTVIDGITGTLLESKFGFDDYRLALGQAGGVAGKLGVSFDDMNAALATTGSAFASGSDAGTSLKTFIQRLVPQSKEAAQAMREYGLSFYDAAGKMRPIADIAQNLKTQLGALSQEAQNEVLTKLFGSDAVRTALGLMEQGAAGITRMKEAIAKGSAEEQAAARMKGFNGEMEKFRSAIEGLQIAIADSGFLEWATSVVAGLSELISYLAQSDPAILKFSVVVAGLAAVLPPVIAGLGLIAIAIGAIGIPAALVITAIAGLTALVVAFWPEIVNLTNAIGSLVSGAFNGIVNSGAYVIGALTDMTMGIGSLITNGFTKLINLGAPVIQTLTDIHVNGLKALGEAFVIAKDLIVSSVQAMYEGVKTWLGDKLSAIFQPVINGVESVKRAFFNMYDAVVGHSYVPDMVDGVEDHFSRLDNVMVKPAKTAADTVTQAFQGLESNIGSMLDELVENGKLSFDSLKKAAWDMAKTLFVNPAIKALTNSLQGAFGGFLGGGAGLGAPLNLVPAFATGGSFSVGGSGGIDSQLVMFRASPNEQVDVRTPSQVMRDDRDGSDNGYRMMMRPTVNIYAQDAQSVIRAETQVAASMARAVQRGRRGL
jgi:TP901 family phage tail tape measure protein